MQWRWKDSDRSSGACASREDLVLSDLLDLTQYCSFGLSTALIVDCISDEKSKDSKRALWRLWQKLVALPTTLEIPYVSVM